MWRTTRIIGLIILSKLFSYTNADFEVMYNIYLEIEQILPGLAFFFTSRILLRARWSNFDRSASEGIIYLNIEVKILIIKIVTEVRIQTSNQTKLT